MDQGPDPGGTRRLGDSTRAEVVDRVKALAAALSEDADEIDHRIGALRRRKKRVGKAHIGLDRRDLADAPQRLQEACKLRPAHGDPHPRPGLGQRPDHMAADEA